MAIQRSTLVTKAQELMNTEGLDYATAAKRAKEAMTTTTPVIPTQPSLRPEDAQGFVAGTPTYNQGNNKNGWGMENPKNNTISFGEATAGMNAEQRKRIRGGELISDVQTTTPAPMTQAPVDQTTGLSKPLEPVAQPVQQAPVTPTPVQAEVKAPEVKPVVASQKTEAPVDYTQAKGREQEIINNLNTFKAQNMTPEQIMKASDYQNATPEKRALIEPYLKQQVPTASAMYSAIVAKADIPDEQKTSLPFKIAQNRYTKASSYSTMTPSQLANEMNNSRFIQGSQAYEDVKAMNPKLIQDTENLRIVNGSKQNIFTYVNNPDGTSTKVNNLEKTFAEEYMDNFGDAIKQLFAVQTPEQIRAIIRTPDAAQAEDKAFELEGKIDEIDKLIEESDKKVEESLAGSGASGQRIQLEKSAQREKLEKDKRSIEKEYNRYANKANNIITQNTTLYLNSQAQKEKQATALLPILQDQYKTAQAKAQAEQALNDPATQIKATMDEFEKMGITSQGSLASKIAEFKTSGLSLPEYVNNLRKLYMAKPEYQRIQAQEAGKGISYQTIGDKVYKNTNGVLTETGISAGKTDATPNIQRIGGTTENPVFGYFKDGKLIPVNSFVSSTNAPNKTSEKLLDIPTGTDVGVQCGTFARQLCGLDATPGGNSLEARQKAFKDTSPVAGGMVLFTGNGYDKTYGHISSIESVNQDGTMNIVESNLNGDNKVTRRTIKVNDPAISGFYNDTPLAKSPGEKQYTDSDIAILGSVTKLDKQGKSTLSDNGLTERDWANFNAGLLPPTAKQKQESQTIVNKVDDILAGDWSDAVGIAKSMIFTGAGSDRKVTELKVQALKDLLAMANLDKIKGAMSDKDIEFLRNTATYLSTDLSETEFEKTLTEIKNKYANIAGGTPTTQPTETPSTPTNTGVGQTYQGYTIKGL